jgi:hypothetical protein
LQAREAIGSGCQDDALEVLDSTWISNLEQPCMGAILYGVGVNTHKELVLEVLMTLAPVINEGVSCLSFALKMKNN